ncbi:hypothetical protein ACO0LC_09320 [Undibacterium sp. JH2W]|uniref:hypothetical protein n=1 Tax=Undibacterium sp. JH2W TaxID=3413037 RepID=UPI003BF1F120
MTFIIAFFLMAGQGDSAFYQAASISEDLSQLTIVSKSGKFRAPLTEDEQQAFEQPRISGSGLTVAWLAATKNCCTSYPLPTALVIFRKGKVIRRFQEAPPIWGWSFARGDTAVAYRQSYPHGVSPIFYKLRRISDGKLLATFTCHPKYNEANEAIEGFQATGTVPTWVKGIANECPAGNVTDQEN